MYGVEELKRVLKNVSAGAVAKFWKEWDISQRIKEVFGGVRCQKLA